jgi:hypothetical protein
MAVPAKVLENLEKLPSGVQWARPEPAGARELPRVLSLGFAELDAVLPDGGLPRGAVVELAVRGGAALASSLVLAACRGAQQQAAHQGSETPWCAFIEPDAHGEQPSGDAGSFPAGVGGSLYAPAVKRAGVDANRLLVVRPPVEALSRIALRVADSQAFAVIGIDTMGALGSGVRLSLASWPRVVRRLSATARDSAALVLLITDAEARRPLPLPVAMRLEIARPAPHQLTLEVAKERYGRISGPRTVTWARRRPTRGASAEWLPKGVRSTRPPPPPAPNRGADGTERLFA